MVRGGEVAGGGCAGTGDGHGSYGKWSCSAGESQGTVRWCACSLPRRHVEHHSVLMLIDYRETCVK